jgi:RNA polymerase sigma-70 factor (ECF subfamily)
MRYQGALTESIRIQATEVISVPKPDWDSIVLANAATVTTAAMRVLGCLADAEDVAQEVFIEAFGKWDSGADNAWVGLLRRMAICRSLDVLRTRKRIASLNFQPVDSREGSPSDSLLRQERLKQLRTAVAQLPAREAEVFCLACFELMSHEAISSTLEISSGAVATILSRAKAKLTQIIEVVERESK